MGFYLKDPDSEVDSWQTEFQKKVEKVMDIIAKILLAGFAIFWLWIRFK